MSGELIPTGLRRVIAARQFGSDGSVAVLAAAVVLGAWRPLAWPVVVPVGLVLASLAVRRPVLLVPAVFLLAGTLAHGALAGAAPAPPGRLDAAATLVTDPDDAFGAARALVRADGHRYELRARGSAGGQLRRMLAGESVRVSARVTPRRDQEDWLLTRHVVGHLDAEVVQPVGRGDPASRLANAYRRLLDRGAEVLDPQDRALFTGFVLGDDRFQDDATIDEFRATGLSHLLCVSGENLVFALVLLRPLVTRTDLRTRFLVVAAALGMFALLTRFEPSVLRAAAMALIAALGSTLGRPISPLRALGLAVAALVLIDPLLARSFGFQLSVAACAGIVLLAGPLTRWLPGPRTLAGLVSVTLAAQIFVAPLLAGTADGVPVAALPANVLAVPAAGPLMMWGMTAGALAGLTGPGPASLLHLPTRLLLWWVRLVSAHLAAAPLGQLGTAHVVALAGIAALIGLVARAGVGRSARGLLAGAGIAVVLVTAVRAQPPPPAGPSLALGVGAELWRGTDGATALVVDGRARAGPVLSGLRAARVRTIDVVVARTASRSSAGLVGILTERFGPVPVLAPNGAPIPGLMAPDGEVTATWEGLELQVTPDGDRLNVTARPVGGAGVASHGASPVARSRSASAARSRPGRPARAVARGPPVRHPVPGRRHGHPQPHARLLL